MEYVKRLPESQSSTNQTNIVTSTPMNNGTSSSSVVTADPFHFESIGDSEGLNTGYGVRHGGGPSNER